MEKTLVVNVVDGIVRIALLHDGRLLELHKEEENKQYVVGDIYLGKVKKLSIGLNSAFVGVGSEKDAFLHYHDLGPQINSLDKFTRMSQSGKYSTMKMDLFKREKDIDKNGKISETLKQGQQVLVQVVKEPISTKGPRVSSEISLPGRFLVLVPFSDKISISQKIKSGEEKTRLRKILQHVKPKGFGIIVRTASEGKSSVELHADINYLVNKWQNCFKVVSKKSAPLRVHTEASRASTILRDLFDDSFVKIVCDDQNLCNELVDYVKLIAPEKENIVEFYDKPTPILEQYNVEKQVKLAFGKTVNVSKGVYLVIEHTEAMHVIDVNSGNTNKFKESQEKAALEVNLIAATEIARQLRLRDMGGIVVVDFIDMRSAEHRKELFDHMREVMNDDTARHKILPLSKFGLMQITRQRVRPALKIKTQEANPSSTQEVQAPIHLINKIEGDLIELWKTHGKVVLHIHPFIAAYLTKGIFSIKMKWFLKYQKSVKVIPRHAFNFLEYKYFDAQNNEIKI